MASGSFNGDDDNEFSPLADINMTPFIDVMLVLLVIFMLTASILATGMKVELPKAAAAKPIENQKPVVITLNADRQIQVADRTVQREGLVGEVRAELGGAERTIQLRADQGVRYGEVVGILDLLVSAGLNKVALIAEHANNPQQAADPHAGHMMHDGGMTPK
jgi:biopolymer transport protein TolR